LDAETWVLILTLIGYLLSMIWVGYRVPNRIQGKDVYVLAGRNLPWFVLALAFHATIADVNQVMGQPGFAYGGGISYLFWINAAMTIDAIPLPRVGTRLRGLNLTTVTDFARCNGVYKKFSAQDPPARTTIGAGLPGILVEASCVAGVRGSA
jgi:Na+/proline symporter